MLVKGFSLSLRNKSCNGLIAVTSTEKISHSTSNFQNFSDWYFVCGTVNKKGGTIMNTMMKRGNGNTPAASVSGMIDKIFQNNLSRFFDDSFWGFNGLNTGNQPMNVPVNLKDTGKSYELEVIAPGLRKEDFKINVTGDTLTVAFEQKEEQNEENKSEGWLRKEFRMRSFSRSFNLDDTIDASKISAKYRDGVLCLSLPKKEGAQPLSRTIEIGGES